MKKGSLTRVVHCKKEPYDIYIGRPSIYGNPFSHKPGTLAKYQVDTVEDAIWEYERWLRHQLKTGAITLSDIRKLKGNVLGCWCKPGPNEHSDPNLFPCHGDILVEYAERLNY